MRMCKFIGGGALIGAILFVLLAIFGGSGVPEYMIVEICINGPIGAIIGSAIGLLVHMVTHKSRSRTEPARVVIPATGNPLMAADEASPSVPTLPEPREFEQFNTAPEESIESDDFDPFQDVERESAEPIAAEALTMGMAMPGEGEGPVYGQPTMRPEMQPGMEPPRDQIPSEPVRETSGVLVGGLMMLGAVVWFVAGLAMGWIYFYPPVLFIIGLVTLIRGVASR